MIIGMSTATFTLLHVIISLIGIFTGLIVAVGLWTGETAQHLDRHFPAHDRSDECHGIHVSRPGSRPRPRGGQHLTGGARDCDRGVLRLSRRRGRGAGSMSPPPWSPFT